MVENTLFEKRFAQMAGVKYYRIDANSTSNSFFLNVETINQHSYVKNNRGYFYGLKYAFFDNRLIFKGNYEYATRLPDQYELLGDRVFIISNPILVPEESNNYNIGFLSQVNTKLGRVELEYNRFIRNTQNNIYLVPSKFGAQYQNLANVKSLGHEATLNYLPLKFVRLSFAATYQDVRNVSDTTDQFSAIDKRYYNKTLPNIPLQFGNAEILLILPKIFIGKDRLELFYNTQYTDAFFLSFAEEGLQSTKDVIPEQFIQNAGFSYALPFNRASLSVEVHNLADAKAFDNFYIRKPGRSFHVKLRFFINKSI
jgi:outer membrane receptor for ferrienterochelin and colicin